MAKRRMLSIEVCGSDDYLDLSPLAQALYIQLIINADDDGLLGSVRKIQRYVGANDSDVEMLIKNNFLIRFDSGVVAIRHWLLHNTVRKDRYTPTIYIEERNKLLVQDNREYSLEAGESYLVYMKFEKEPSYSEGDNQMATNGKPSDNQTATNGKPNGNPDKNRLDKSSVDKNNINNKNNLSIYLGGGRNDLSTEIISKEQEPSPAVQALPPPEKTQKKKAYGKHKYVLLSNEEIQEVRLELTDEQIQGSIDYIDEHMHKNKHIKPLDFKNALMTWGKDGYIKTKELQEKELRRNNKTPPSTNAFTNMQMHSDYDMDKLEKALISN